MGQSEIVEWLRHKRLEGEEKYFTSAEIYKALNKDNGGTRQSIYRQINKLVAYGFVEADTDKHFNRRFRLKAENVIKEDLV